MTILKRIIKTLPLFLVIAAIACSILPSGAAQADATWTQTTQADFTAGTLVQLDATSSPGDVKLAQYGTGTVYAFKGNNTKNFWCYDVAANTWSALANAPQNVEAGGALAYDGGNYIYALGGNGQKYFWRYDITANSWSTLASTHDPVNAGGALVCTGSYLYAFRGGDQKSFWRYDISANSWTGMRDAPGNVNGGGALAWGGGDYIYALKGGSTTFWRYSISGNTWSTLAPTLSTVGDGGALASDGNQYVYALKGNDTDTFWRYNISANSWAAMADTPVTPCVYGGGALVYDGNAHCYALRGNNYPDFWKYDVSPNTWSIIASAPSAVAYGGALAFKPGTAYYTSGALTSSTYDTGSASDFGTLSWTAVTPASTAIKFQIATNNDSATWNFKGPDGTSSTYYTSSGATIWSGAGAARYIKYKAFFSTTNTATTPVLNDVSITYHSHIILPAALTSNAALVEETSSTLHGSVAADGGEACQYRFRYGTAPGAYTFDTSWTGSVTTGQTFSADITGLTQGTLYYFVAQVKNSAGSGTGSELIFLTKPEAPANLVATIASSTQINLSWTKGIGANRTKVLRKTGSYPTNYNDGTVVYFDTGTSVSDTGLSANTTYYYRAWSEVTKSSLQQWSDDYASISPSTSGAPSASTSPAMLVEETTATLHGYVAADGGEACQYRFQYGTAPGAYTFNTSWMGSLTTGQNFSVNLTGLAEGTKYYFVAQVKNSAGIGSGVELEFLTKPLPPDPFIATAVSDTRIDLTWVKGAGAQKTLIRRSTSGYPVDRNDGDLVYFDTGTSFSDTGLTPNTLYYYRGWSYVSGSEQWSDDYSSANATTLSPPTTPPTTTPPTTTPPTTTPKMVGGEVYPINKIQLILPWLCLFGLILLVGGGIACKIIMVKFDRR
jgi:hypothetical protein